MVIMIIGLLATVLYTAIESGLNSARRTMCAANLRNWGILFRQYITDNPAGTLPHTDDRSRNRVPGKYDPKHPEHEQCYVDVLFEDGQGWRDYPRGGKPRSGIWQCPSAHPLSDSAYSYKPSVDGYHSYVMNSYLEHDFLYGLPVTAKPQPSFLNPSIATDPSKTILMFEATLNPSKGYGGAGGFRDAGRYTAEDPRAVASRHRFAGKRGSNVLYLDGHVGWAISTNLWDKTRRNPRVPKRGDLTWYPYYY